MAESDSCYPSFTELLAWMAREPDNPLAQTLTTNYELDTVHKSIMAEDARKLLADQRRLGSMTPAEMARHMIQFDKEGNLVMPESAPPSKTEPAGPEDVIDDGIRLHSDNVTHIHQAGASPGKVAAVAAGVIGSSLLAALVTWGLMGGAKERPAERPAQPASPATAPGLFEKDPKP